MGAVIIACALFLRGNYNGPEIIEAPYGTRIALGASTLSGSGRPVTFQWWVSRDSGLRRMHGNVSYPPHTGHLIEVTYAVAVAGPDQQVVGVTADDGLCRDYLAVAIIRPPTER